MHAIPYLSRWVHRVTRGDLLAHAVPRWTAAMLLVAELDAIVDWRATARTAWASPPLYAGIAVALACGLAGEDARRIFDATLRGPRLAVLRRQPVAATAWGAGALVLTAPLAAWLPALAAPLTGLRPGPMLLWWALALVPVAAARRTDRWLASLGAGAVAMAAHATGAAALWALAAWALAVPVAGRLLLRDAADHPDAIPSRVLGAPRSALSALVHRDALLLWRLHTGILASGIANALFAGVAAGLMYRTGDWAGPALTAGAMVLLAAPSFGALRALTEVARGLGRRFDPPEWPVSARTRALALGTVAAALLAPSWAAAAVAAPRIGLGHLQLGAFVAAVALGAAWWVAARPGRPHAGSWPYWLGACLGACLVPGGVLWGGLLAGLALSRTTAALEARRGHP